MTDDIKTTTIKHATAKSEYILSVKEFMRNAT